MTALDSLMEQWVQKRHSWEEVDKIFQSATFLAIISKMRRIWMVSFYWSTIPSSDLIKKQLEEDTEFMRVMNNFLTVFLVFMALAMFNFLVLKVQEIMVYFRSTIAMLPLELVMKNGGLFNYLKNVQIGKKEVV